MTDLIEIVPNVSEGRDKRKIADIAQTLQESPDCQLLHIDSGYSANRTVFTFCCRKSSIIPTLMRFASKVFELIDMSHHSGTHPRIGAIDVMPIIPLSEVSVSECIGFVYTFANLISSKYNLPIYLYELAARQDYRKSLEQIRKGEYEGLRDKLLEASWMPDFGPAIFNSKLGAMAIGVRDLLIAYNVDIDGEVDIAKKIAQQIRENSGSSFALKSVKAIGWEVPEYQSSQVSMNLVNYRETGLAEAFSQVKILAERHGVKVIGSEIVGLVPKEALLAAASFFEIDQHEFNENMRISSAIQKLGLNLHYVFDIKEKILEFALK